MRTITPFLWFDHEAEEAMNLYLSIFKDGKSLNVTRVNGKIMTATFEMLGQKFIALNAGPMYKFNEAVSFFVSCDTQAEVDELWERLSEGGSKGRCGWLKDKYGLSWQIIPKALGELGRPRSHQVGRGRASHDEDEQDRSRRSAKGPRRRGRVSEIDARMRSQNSSRQFLASFV